MHLHNNPVQHHNQLSGLQVIISKSCSLLVNMYIQILDNMLLQEEHKFLVPPFLLQHHALSMDSNIHLYVATTCSWQCQLAFFFPCSDHNAHITKHHDVFVSQECDEVMSGLSYLVEYSYCYEDKHYCRSICSNQFHLQQITDWIYYVILHAINCKLLHTHVVMFLQIKNTVKLHCMNHTDSNQTSIKCTRFMQQRSSCTYRLCLLG